MNVPKSKSSHLFTGLAWLLLSACGDDVAVETATATEGMTTEGMPGTTTSGLTVELTTETPTTSEGETTTETPTTSEGETTATCADGTPACEGTEYPIEGAPFAVSSELHMLDSKDICAGMPAGTPELLIKVFYPEVLPNVPLPFAILTNGANQNYLGYDHILSPLAAMGFIAVSVQSVSEVEHRVNAMACTLRWLRSQWVSDNCVTPNCDLVLIGHSRGGEAAWVLGNSLASVPWSDIVWQGVDVNLKAVVGIAPRFKDVAPYAPDKAVPYLGIMGATDDDVPGQAIRAYDSMVREAARTDTDPGKVLLWPYDVPHGAFGGKSPLGLPVEPGLDVLQYGSKGRAIASAFIPAFVDLFVFGNDALHAVFTGEDFPGELTPDLNMDMVPDLTWWSYLEPTFTEIGEVPVILRDFALDQRDNPGIRQYLDDFEDEDFFKFDSTLAANQWIVGEQKSLASVTNVSGHHGGQLMRVRWGEPQAGGEITWELNAGAGLALEDFSFFSLRIGQELILSEVEALDACKLPPADPRAEALELTVRLQDSGENTAEVALGPIVQQHSQRVHVGGAPANVTICGPSQFMPTLRIPMSGFCASPGFDITSVVSLTIEFPEILRPAGVYLDTLEFTRHPLDEDNLCP